MRTIGPLVLGILAGWIAFGELFVEHEHYRWLFELLRDFAQILASTAFILGGLNLVQVNYPKIRRRQVDWQYKTLMLGSAAIMGIVGIQWHTFGSASPQGSVAAATSTSEAEAGMAILRFDSADREALVSVDGQPAQRAWYSRERDPGAAGGDAAREAALDKGSSRDLWSPPGDKPLSIQVKPGKHDIAVFMPVAGYKDYKETFEVAAGQLVVIKSDLSMLWGAGSPDGRVFTWFYDHVFYPCNATMFALLAFFIASAAFRAFRARNVESALLLGSAILVMIGLVPIGRTISPFFPELADWIVDFPNNAGRRAIMMGAALGAIVTGLRVILGLERSHLGQEGN